MNFPGRARLVGTLAAALCALQTHAEIYNYSNPEDDFSPTSEHKQAHRISGEDFQRNDEYRGAVITVPVLLCALGAASILLLDILICCRSAKIPTKDGHSFAWIIYYALTIGVLITGACVYIGYADVEDGFGKLDDTVKVIQDDFDTLVIYSESLRENYDTMIDNCAISTCCNGPMDSYFQDFDRALGQFEDDTDGVVDSSQDVLDYMENYGGYGILFTLLIFFFVLFAVFFYLVFGFCKSRGGLNCACCCGNTTFIIVMVLGAIFMMGTAVTGDICYDDPTYAILNQVPPGKGQQYITWYSTCGSTGDNPLFEYTYYMGIPAEGLLVEITEVEGSVSGCDTETEFQNVRTAVEAALITLDDINEHIADCTKIQDSWFVSVNDGICGTFFTGLRTCWLVAVISTLLIFLLQIPSAVVRSSCSSHATVAPKPGPPAPMAPIRYQQPEAQIMMVPMQEDSQMTKNI